MKKNFISVFLIGILFLFSLCGLAEDDDGLFSMKDLTIVDAEDAEKIALSGESITITEAGSYVLSGTIEDGSINIALEEKGTVYLLLNGVTVSNSQGSAMTVSGCSKLILTLCPMSVNTLTQGSETPEAEDNTAAIYSSSDLTITGTGTLVVNGNYEDGIYCKDTLRIVDGTLAVTAEQDGLVGKDSLIVGGGTITVATSNGDAIKSTKKNDEENGNVIIAGGVINLSTGNGASSVVHTAENPFNNMMTDSSTTSEDSVSLKGLKAQNTINISGGTITIDSEDDAIHSNNNIIISGGTISIASGDDGIHADNTLTLSDGIIDITESYEGIEATDIILSGGTLSIVAFDDGINGAGGDSASDSSQASGNMGFGRMDMFSTSTGTLEVSGGNILVYSNGDGIDINGNIQMTGGSVYVASTSSGANAALDYDGSFTLVSGTVVAVGSSGMALGVNDPSIPGAMLTVSGGDLSVSDSSGNNLLSFSNLGSYNSAVLYSDLFTENETYLVTTGANTQSVQMTTTATTGFSMGGFGGGGRGDFGRWDNTMNNQQNGNPFGNGQRPGGFRR